MKYVRPFSATLRNDAGNRVCTLIWGDPVHVLDDTVDPWKVKARTREGRLPPGEYKQHNQQSSWQI